MSEKRKFASIPQERLKYPYETKKKSGAVRGIKIGAIIGRKHLQQKCPIKRIFLIFAKNFLDMFKRYLLEIYLVQPILGIKNMR